MNTVITPTLARDVRCDLLVVGCNEISLKPGARGIDLLDAALDGVLRQAIRDERFGAKPGQLLVLHTFGKLPSHRIALIGLGSREQLRADDLRIFAGRATRLAQTLGASHVALSLGVDQPTSLPNPAVCAQRLAEGAHLGTYRFDRYLSEEKRLPRTVATVELLLGPNAGPPEALSAALLRGKHLSTAISRARDLVNEPAGVLTPTRLADIAVALAHDVGLQVQILGPAECRKLGMGLYLAVAQGSAEEPRFIHLTWKPATPAKHRVVLVGKGVTFDSGGLSLKPNDGMLDMKTDMAGAAAVLSVMSAIAAENLPIEVHAIAACTENMPSGTAYKLGDVLRSKAGKTVEINNTDAEGRLTLADAITYGLELKPDQIFDFATLTGACIVALGPHTAGVMSNNDVLCSTWLAAASAAGEEMWRLPLPGRLFEQLKSDIADMKNTGERWGGALTAGLFLREFVGETPWVHIDLAGPSTADKDMGDVSKGGTGFAVLTIFEHLARLASS